MIQQLLHRHIQRLRQEREVFLPQLAVSILYIAQMRCRLQPDHLRELGLAQFAELATLFDKLSECALVHFLCFIGFLVCDPFWSDYRTQPKNGMIANKRMTRVDCKPNRKCLTGAIDPVS